MELDTLRALIKLSGKSQREIARDGDLTPPQVSAYLSGKLTLTYEAIGKFAQALGIPHRLMKHARGIKLKHVRDQIIAALELRAKESK